MRDQGLQEVGDKQVQAPEELQEGNRGLEDEPRLSTQREGREGRPRTEDVKGAVGMCESEQAGEAEATSRVRPGFIEVRRWI